MTAEQLHDALTLLPADLVAEVDKKRSRSPRIIPWKRYAAMAACFAVVLCSSWLCLRLFLPRYAADTAEAAPAEIRMAQENGAGSNAEQPEAMAAMSSAEEAEAEAAPAAANLPSSTSYQEKSTSTDTATSAEAESSTLALDTGISQPIYLEAILNTNSSACFTTPTPKLFCSRAELEAYCGKPISPFDLTSLMEACECYDEAWFESRDLLLVTLCSVPADNVSPITAIYEADSLWYVCIESCPDNTEALCKNWYVLIETEKGLIDSADSVMLIYE